MLAVLIFSFSFQLTPQMAMLEFPRQNAFLSFPADLVTSLFFVLRLVVVTARCRSNVFVQGIAATSKERHI